MKRRAFVTLAAALPAAADPRQDLGRVKLRKTGKVEIAFPSPGPQPNGLQATRDGLWVIDQSNNKAYLLSYSSGKVLREFLTEADRASGITFDGQHLWIGSTYSREIIQCDAQTGKTVRRYFTPGAGVLYHAAWDPPHRISPLAKRHGQTHKAPTDQTGAPAEHPGAPRGCGTGAHGQEWRDGKLWMAVPPSRMIYRLDPANWTVEKQFPTAGNRPHGLGWEGRYLWCADTNLNAFFKHDPETGQILEKIRLAEHDPLPHGMTIWNGVLWYCDDVGVICRMKI
jgi:streptogramin lyase